MSEYSVTNVICVTHRSPQTTGQKTKIEMGLSRKYLWKRFFPTGVNLHVIHKKPTRFLRMLYHKKYCQLGLKETERRKIKEGFLIPKILQERNRLVKTTQ